MYRLDLMRIIMSLDYNIYLSSIEGFDKFDCERYYAELGLKVELNVGDSVTDCTGFLPIKLLPDFLGDSEFTSPLVTGFEVFFDEYTPKPARKKSMFEKFFGIKPDIPAYSDKLSRCTCVMNLYCSELLETLVILPFAAYLCKNFDVVFEDPQSERFYLSEEEIIADFNWILAEVKHEYDEGLLEYHKFEGWQ